MNTGRLHAVLEMVARDYEKNEVLPNLQAVVNALSTSINSPTEEHASAFRGALDRLYTALSESPTNAAVPSQVDVLKEIGGTDKVGFGLSNEIKHTLDSNKVTPANALSELQAILEVSNQFDEKVRQIIEGFEELKIPYEELDPGEAEIGVLVPWTVIDSNLNGLQKELHQFDKALQTFGELAENNPKSPVIRSVGSSLLQMFIESTPGIVLCVAAAIERLCALYKQILDIKLVRKQLKEKSLPEAAAAILEAHEQEIAEKEIEKIADDLIREFGKNRQEERLNELRTALRTALRFFAAQLDAGVDMEVRSEPPRAKDVAARESSDVKSPKVKKALEQSKKTVARIKRATAAMRMLKRADTPILMLGPTLPSREKRSKK